jgi:HD-GYP domain-containing protein (c-di-GMP phosphodiesterase class II)
MPDQIKTPSRPPARNGRAVGSDRAPSEPTARGGAARNVIVDAACLRQGLFVFALDRSWEETKFLFQGFLIANDEELSLLRESCSWAIVDLARSVPEATFGLSSRPVPAQRRRAVGRGRPSADKLAPGDVVPARPAPRDEPSRRARDERIEQLLERTAGKTGPMPDERWPAEVPKWEHLVEYAPAPATIQQDLPSALQATRAATSSLRKFSEEILTRGELQVQKIEAAACELTECMIENPNTLHWLLRARDKDRSTYDHNIAVAVYLLALGRQLGYPPKRLMEFATIGLLLDVGKLFVDRAILTKAGALTEQEVRDVQRHVELGLEALAPESTLAESVVTGLAQHHERLDGMGYPKRLKDTEISMEGRLAAIADGFAAMTSERPYAPVLTAYQAMQELYRRSGAFYQESLVDKFVEAVGVFPIGSLVELSSGEIAVVVRHNRQRRLEPCVLVLTDRKRAPLDIPIEIDLLSQHQLSVEHKLIRLARALQPGEVDFDLGALYLT